MKYYEVYRGYTLTVADGEEIVVISRDGERHDDTTTIAEAKQLVDEWMNAR